MISVSRASEPDQIDWDRVPVETLEGLTDSTFVLLKERGFDTIGNLLSVTRAQFVERIAGGLDVHDPSQISAFVYTSMRMFSIPDERLAHWEVPF